MQHVAAALLAVLVLSWTGSAFGVGATAAAGHGVAYDFPPSLADSGGAGHDHDHDDHHHPGHALDEHANLGHMLDHLSGSILDVTFVTLAPVKSGSVGCPPLMSLLTATLSPLYRPPINAASA
ncbi:MAG: hypothetical protein IPM80_24050 [Proteobacteria bacterium]|nr:hypothetical protein [Pseudomonadota bacterium]